MAKVICTLPNASTLINGVKFVEHEAGVISEDVSDDVAAAFTRIKGYILDGVKAVDTDLADLRARAEALGVKVKGNWSKDRLSSEVAKAQAKASADAPAPAPAPAPSAAPGAGEGNTGADGADGAGGNDSETAE